MMSSKPGVIVYGPQGCGKTRNAQAIAKHLGLTNIIDEWCPGYELPADTLALTDCRDVEGAVNFFDVMDALNVASS